MVSNPIILNKSFSLYTNAHIIYFISKTYKWVIYGKNSHIHSDTRIHAAAKYDRYTSLEGSFFISSVYLYIIS